MGHLSQKEELLKALQERLDKNPVGVPPHEALFGVLEILFTEKEAYVGSRFPLLPSPFEVIEKAVEPLKGDELRAILKSMSGKGLVIDYEKDGEEYFALSMAMVGFFEYTFMRTSETLPMRKLAELMHDYRQNSEFYKDFFGSETNRTRILIYESTLPKVTKEVLTYEKASELIKEAGYGSLTKCYCRHEAQHLGDDCKKAPIDDICMGLGRGSDYLIKHGYARRATVDELLAVLKKAEELGLVHLSDNVQDKPTFICNCCGCHCGILDGINKKNMPNAIAPSNYIASSNQELCIACGTCEESCQINAIELVEEDGEEFAVVNQMRCLGCGICAHVCPEDAMDMKERENIKEPPKKFKELWQRLILEKGKTKFYI